MASAENELSLERVAPEAGFGPGAFDALPAARGVVVFENDERQTSLLATTGDIRAFARRRLLGDRPSPQREVTRVVRAAVTGSLFESELVCLALARERLPGTYGALTDRMRGWFLHCDLEDEFPRFVKASTGDWPGSGTLLGPIGDKHAAARAREALEDTFDLCRYHQELVKAPGGTACAYKEMGRCPAACDGSETVDVYRARFAQAVEFVAGGPREAISGIESQMRQAAGAQDFESAERFRKMLERAKPLGTARVRHTRAFALFGWLAVCASPKKGHARLICAAGERAGIAGDVDRSSDDIDAVEKLVDQWRQGAQAGFECEGADVIGLVSQWLYRPEKSLKRHGARFLRLDRSATFGQDLRSALRGADAEAPGDDDDEESLSIEAT